MEGFSWLVFSFNLIVLLSRTAIAADTLTYGSSLIDGQTLVSASQVFELGFFSPGISKSRYLGIWYKNISFTAVWVANRDNPIPDLSGTLIINKSGILVLSNRNGTVFWSSKSGGGAFSPVAQILDNGNLVLRQANVTSPDSYIWQSFDFPTDTLLPGMKQGWNLKTGLNRNLTSWKSSDDPSTGSFSYGMELHGLPQLVLRMGSNDLYRSGLGYQDRFVGSPDLSANSVFEPVFVSNSDEVYYKYESTDPSLRSRLVLGQTGLVQQYTWMSNQNQWVVLYSIMRDQCDNYNHCGPFGVCNITAASNCKCMTGFTPKSPHNWQVFDASGGCVRISPLDCRKGEGFMKYTAMKLPDTANLWVNLNMSSKECEAACLNNCSCTGYAEMDTSENGKGCLAWSGDLIDVREATDGGQDLYVRLSASALKLIADSRERRRNLKLVIALPVSSVLFLLGLIIGLVTWRKKMMIIHGGGQVVAIERNHPGGSKEAAEFPVFDLATIAAATKNFSFSSKIGEGGFGPVYKGVLPITGQEIAVKKLSTTSRQGFNELKNEVLLIFKLQHRNLVRLLGCCVDGEERMLIYEFLANGSLDAFIFDKTRRTQLRWESRFNIIVGIARGLLYLHRDSRLRIIHRDLKASNILLDNEMNPKISDFGLARTFGGDETEASTKIVVGTYGYMSPEYAVDGNFSVKSDVFSFGVLVLEIVSGRKNRGFYDPEHDLNLLGHAWKLWDEGKAMGLLDASMEDRFSATEAARCIHVGLLCVQQRTEDRPTMSSVVMMLDGEGPLLSEPKQPGFFTERCLSETDSSSRKRKSGVSVEVSITMVEGR